MSLHSLAHVTALVSEEQLGRIRKSVETDGVEVIRAQDLDQATSSLAAVIVCDADGTKQPWHAVLKEILDVRPMARVLLLSRRADDQMWTEVLTRGGFDLLPNPCHPREIRSAVLGALDLGEYCAAA